MAIEPCPVPPKERTIGYIHGWNKACKKQSECIPYPRGWKGVRYAANNTVIPPMTSSTGKRIAPPAPKYIREDLPEPTPTKTRAARKPKESTEEKLARARKRRAKK